VSPWERLDWTWGGRKAPLEAHFGAEARQIDFGACAYVVEAGLKGGIVEAK